MVSANSKSARLMSISARLMLSCNTLCFLRQCVEQRQRGSS